MVVEESTNRARLDMAVRFEGRAAYVFEFTVVEQAGEGAAMAQLVEREYTPTTHGRRSRPSNRKRQKPLAGEVNSPTGAGLPAVGDALVASRVFPCAVVGLRVAVHSNASSNDLTACDTWPMK